MSARVGALLAAAGRGERFGGTGPKALHELRRVPLLVYAVQALQAAPSVGTVVVAAPWSRIEQIRDLLGDGVTVVPGGETRRESVAAALAALPDTCDIVLVHDAARPLAPVDMIERVVGAVLDGAPAVVPGLPLADTVKVVDAGGHVVSTPERAGLRAIQTPQGFERRVLVRAHAAAGGAGSAATDDAGLVEALGVPVLVVPGDPLALKVTTRADLLLAEALLADAR